METFVLFATAVLSLFILLLQPRARAFYVLFLHLLLTLTVGSLALRTLSHTGTLLIPFVEGWSGSPLMNLTGFRAYLLLTVSLMALTTVCSVKAKAILALPEGAKVSHSFVGSPYCCLLMVWIHLSSIMLLTLS